MVQDGGGFFLIPRELFSAFFDRCSEDEDEEDEEADEEMDE